MTSICFKIRLVTKMRLENVYSGVSLRNGLGRVRKDFFGDYSWTGSLSHRRLIFAKEDSDCVAHFIL